jgi:hypothetical protein
MLTIAKACLQKVKFWPMRAKVVLALLGLLVGQAAPIYAFVRDVGAISDTTPVTVQAFTASSSTVDVDADNAQIELSGTVRDDLSGFASVQAYYTSPSEHQVAEAQVTALTATGFTAEVTIPRYSEAGVWKPTATFTDTATNTLTLTPQELADHGFLLNVTVRSSTPDTTAPTIGDIELDDTTSVDTNTSAGQVSVIATATDDISGIADNDPFASGTIRYISPSGKQSVSAILGSTVTPDIYRTVVIFPQYTESGVWVPQVSLNDKAGNTRVYDANDLSAMGFAMPVTVTSVPDTTPNTVTQMDFAPISQEYYDSTTMTGGAIVTMELRLSDDLSGVYSPDLLFRSTTSSQTLLANGWCVSNDGSTAYFQYIVNFPKYAAEGDWLPELSTSDPVGNQKLYSYNDLRALGFDTKITLGTSVTESVNAGETVTTDTAGTGATDAAPIQAAVTSPTAGNVSVTPVGTASVNGDFTGYSLLSQQFSISAPAATVNAPLVLTFTVDASQLNGIDPNDITIFRDGSAVGRCIGSSVANPDPCIASLTTAMNGDVTIKVNTSHASQWVLGTKNPTQVPFTFQGFKKSILPAPELNKVDAGSAVPVKFSLGGDFGLDVLADGSPSSQKVDCKTLKVKGDETPTLSANKKDLKVNGNDYYRYDWKTLKGWDGTCRELTFTFTTGESAVAYFKFK